MMVPTILVSLNTFLLKRKKNSTKKSTDTEEASEAEYTHNHRNNDEPVEIKEQ